MKYGKPHLTFHQQVEKLASRGMTCEDHKVAAATLERLGYYRFSAYSYPFRQLLPPDEPRETSVQYRSDQFIEGTSFETVSALVDFDRGLRMLCLDGLEAIELAVRVQVAYTLGARSPFGHLERAHLNGEACDRHSGVAGLTAYEVWSERYARLVSDARAEDFVTHYAEKYDSELPIWVAIEVMDFGSLVRLFGFLQRSDQNAVARAMGIPDGRLFNRMLKSLNYVRNVSAHHARLWNRNLTYQLPSFPEHLIPALGHLGSSSAVARKKPYGVMTLTSYLVERTRPDLQWSTRARELCAAFPASTVVSLSRDMGFPDSWFAEEVWAPMPSVSTRSIPE